MIKTGDICPLFFNPLKNEFQQDIDYIQKFYTTDKILIQIFSDDYSDVISAAICDNITNEDNDILLDEYRVNDTTRLFTASITGLKDSVYTLKIREDNSGTSIVSEPFSVCSDPMLLQETCLIKYSNKDNNSSFDNHFWVDGIQQYFEFRVEGGFKPGGVSQKVDNEQFRTQQQKIIELYSVPYDTYTFTCGNASGVPYWIIQFINNILSLSYFDVNGECYVRSGNSSPEKTQISEDGQMFNMTILLEKMGMSRIRTNGSSTSKFIILNTPKLLTVDRPSLLLSNEDANNIKKLYYDGGYSKMHVHYGGEYTANSGLNIPISIYSPYFLDNDIQVGSWMELSWINPDDPSSICSMTLTVQNDYSIEAGTPTETTYAKADLSNAMTVSLGQNGYAKFNNGLLIQWGYSAGTSSAAQTVYMPTSFYDTNYIAIGSVIKNNADNNAYTFCPIYGYSINSFKVDRNFVSTSTGISSAKFNWIAIGRWK
ncbi:gp53-like domain-containing protein [Bacteroides finegoldii]|uniref:gp53-like domain-containing protein n=1 Tax=Bacteroides finegoldii TaxID=338188 RepID=UPI0022E0466F|nr:hypothetical protein [Bacteroides finegoldii]